MPELQSIRIGIVGTKLVAQKREYPVTMYLGVVFVVTAKYFGYA